MPSDAARTGVLYNGTDTAAKVTVDPAAAKYLAFWHAADRPSDPHSDTGIYVFNGQQVLNEDSFITKVDHTISAKDSVSGTYLFDNTPYSAPDGLNITLQSHHVRRQVVTLEETHVFSSTLLNAFHAGVNRVSTFNNKGVAAINPLGADTSLASTPGQVAARVNVGGLGSLPGGVGAVDHFTHGYNSYQANDDVQIACQSWKSRQLHQAAMLHHAYGSGPGFLAKYCNPQTPFPTCTNMLGNAKRNIMAGPGFENLDFPFTRTHLSSEFQNTSAHSFAWSSSTFSITPIFHLRWIPIRSSLPPPIRTEL